MDRMDRMDKKHEMNGKQLYGLTRFAYTLAMSATCPELRKLSMKQKLALNYVNKESKLTYLNGVVYSNTFTPYYPSRAYDRFIRGISRVASGEPTPVVTNFAVTSQCCCDCWHCSFSERSKTKGLSLDTLRKTISDVQDLGTSVIGITGGEPLLRPDLEDIIASIDDRSMPLLFTTGYKLTRERVEALKDAGLGIPVISLDHYKPEIHNKGRGVTGMFDTALKAIKLFQAAGFYVAVSFVPSRKLVEDKDEFYKIIEFFKDLGINDMRLTSPILAGHLTGHPEELLTKEGVKTVHEAQKFCSATPGYPGMFAYDFFESERYYGCGAGFNYLFIDSSGNACPCDFVMMSLGDIKKRGIKEIWAEMSEKFNRPGCVCYANKCNSTLAEMKPEKWPLPPDKVDEVLERCPSYEPAKMPIFYKKYGLKSENRG